MSDLVDQSMTNRAYNLCAKHGYVLEKFIAKGGFGVVYSATHSSDGLKCVAKICPYNHEVTKAMVENEFNLQKECSHKNVVEVYELLHETDFAIIMMELCDESLSSAQERQPNNSFPENVVKRVCTDIARAIEHIHRKNIAHRDMKTGNIMVKTLPNGFKMYKLSDFGTAKKNGSNDAPMKSFIGTAAYTAPEVVFEEYTSEVDCWGLGIIAYNLLTGKFPYDVESRDCAIASITSESVTKYSLPDDINVSNECRSFVSLLLIKDQKARLKTSLLLRNPFIRVFDLDLYDISDSYSPLPSFDRSTTEIEQCETMYKTWYEITRNPNALVLLDGQIISKNVPFQLITEDVMGFKYEKSAIHPITGEINSKDIIKNEELKILYPDNFAVIPGESADALLRRLQKPISLFESLMTIFRTTQFTRSMLLMKRFIVYALNYLNKCITNIVNAYNAVPAHSLNKISINAADTSGIFATIDVPDDIDMEIIKRRIMKSRTLVSSKSTESAEISSLMKYLATNFENIVKMFGFKYVHLDFESIKRIWNSLVPVLLWQEKMDELIAISEAKFLTPPAIKKLEDGVEFLSKTLPKELKIIGVAPPSSNNIIEPNKPLGNNPFNPMFNGSVIINDTSKLPPPPIVPDSPNYGDGYDEVPISTGNNASNDEVPIDSKDYINSNDEIPMDFNGSVPSNNASISNDGNNNSNGEIPMDFNENVPSDNASINNDGNNNSNDEMPMDFNENIIPGDEVPIGNNDNGNSNDEVPMNFNDNIISYDEVPISNNDNGSNTIPGDEVPIDTQTIISTPLSKHDDDDDDETQHHQGISHEREAELLKRISELEAENEKYKKICEDYFELVKYLTSEN